MARLDAYIDLLFREQASFLLLETGTGANLHGNNGARPVLRQPLTTQQIIGAVGELVPGEMKEAFPGSAVEFRYQSPAGEVQVRFESKGDKATARIVPAQKGAQPTPPKSAPPPAAAPAPEATQPATRVSKPEPGERVVVVRPAAEDASQAMRDLLDTMIQERASDLQNFVKRTTAPYKYPREVYFVDELPKTVSGKIRRTELRARLRAGAVGS